MRTRVNLIAGSLGVGKTTAINHLLAQRPPGERWAVLVNEYGQVGLDAALLEGPRSSESVSVKEVAGGCICCSAGLIFDVTLVSLLRQRPDRLLIEPTGLATASGILETLSRPGIREAIEIHSVISLVDPRHLDKLALTVETQDQIEAADILLANRSDLASAPELAEFDAWAAQLFPPKALVAKIERGRIPLELLDPVRRHPENASSTASLHRHHIHSTGTAAEPAPEPTPNVASEPAPNLVRKSHVSPLATTTGWVLPSDQVFDADQVDRWMHELTTHPGLRRLKAVLHTTSGWHSVNVIDGAVELKASAYRRDSRIELIWMGPERPDPMMLEQSLLACVVAG